MSAVLGNGRPRVAWLKRSLRTKDLREANIRAKPILVEFDRLFGTSSCPTTGRARVTTDLSEVLIERMPWMLEEDEEIHTARGPFSEPLLANKTGRSGRLIPLRPSPFT